MHGMGKDVDNMGLLSDLYLITFEADNITYSGNIEKGKIVGWDEVLEKLKEKYNTKKIIITKAEKIG